MGSNPICLRIKNERTLLMKKKNLGGIWKMRRTDSDYDIDAKVPGSICTDLMQANLLPDPYYRNNSDLFEEAAEYDYTYSREFDIDEADLQFTNIELCCDGLDTLCCISVNGKKLADTDNMHRRWRFDIKDFIKSGKNDISVTIKSPTKYCRSQYNKKELKQVTECRPGFSYLRKAHCMLGWDWGPVIPDGGIWRDIFISFDNGLRIDNVFVTQRHTADGRVFVTAKAEVKTVLKDVKYTLKLDGKTYESDLPAIEVEVENPKLWYPVGYGEQHLYDLELTASSVDESDTYSCRVGLRTAEVVTDKDKFGQSMYFRVNGIPIFSKGANYIIEDSIITRYSKEKTYNLLMQAIESNNNTVRVWGGAIYPHDYFYEICDELGLLVWQDFMFACAQYPNTKEFYDNVSLETEDNIKRLRNHPSLIMWCGNNECETASLNWWHLPQDDLDDYRYLFNKLIRGIVKENDPTRYYMSSSPTGNEDFTDTDSETIGDAHYWEIWFNQKPLDEYLKYHFRFLSEFGFQSFPRIETVKTFTTEDDRNIFTRTMEHHQRSGAANGKILLYLSEEFRYPKDFDSLIYVSQIMQAEAIRAGVEHMRRNRNDFRCMGTLYWQLNDCWPVASWSGIDSLGRWKALQYSSKKFYEDIHLSALRRKDNSVAIALTNDTVNPVSKKVYYSVKNREGGELFKKEIDVNVAPLSSKDIFDIDTKDINRYDSYIEFGMDGEMTGITLLCPNKHFDFEDPEISFTTETVNVKTVIRLTCKSLANFVELKADDIDAKFSDNYFALSAGTEKCVVCDRKIKSLSVRSVRDTY